MLLVYVLVERVRRRDVGYFCQTVATEAPLVCQRGLIVSHTTLREESCSPRKQQTYGE